MIAPLLILSLAFFAGVAVASGFDSAAVAVGAVVAVAAGAGVLALRGGRARALLGVSVATLFALGLVRADDGQPDLGNVASLALGRTVQLTGVVVSDPTVRGSTQELRVAVEALALGGERVAARGDVRLWTPLGPDYRYGDRVRGRATLREPTSAAGRAFADYLATRGIAATGSFTDVETLAQGQGNSLRATVSAARADMDAALARSLDEPLAGLAQGIVTGRRDSLAPDLESDLRDTGLTHLVVISGSNVTLLALLVVASAAGLIGRRRAVWLALAVIGAYTVFVGAEAPVVRAAIMASMLLLAGVAGRRSTAVPAIALAAAVMVAVSPGVVDDLSFQLSFVSTAALALMAAPLRQRLERRLRLDRARRSAGDVATGFVIETGVVTVTAVAATLPLIALHFGRISLVALPANLLVVPAFPLIFLGSLATAILGSIDAGLGTGAGWVLSWLPLSWFVEVAERLAALPFASAAVDGFGLEHALVWYAALGAGAVWLQRAGPLPLPAAAGAFRRLPVPDTGMAAVVAAILIAVNIIVRNAVAAGEGESLEVHVLDVGQGDALLAIAPSGGTLLVDGGPDGVRLLGELADALPAGRRSLDLVVATHPQADHVNGLFAVLDRFQVGELIVAPLNDRTEIGRRLTAVASARGVPVRAAEPGTLLDLGEGALVDVLGPLEPTAAAAGDNLNNGAVVLRLRYGEVSFLLAADIEAERELLLAQQGWSLQATVLKVAHHGSATSSTDLFLRRVRPSVAVITVGAGNRFGHPHPEVLSRLAETMLLRTDEDGTIVLRSDGESIRVVSRR